MEYGYDLPADIGKIVAIKCKECGLVWASDDDYFVKHPWNLCRRVGSSWRDIKIEHLELIRESTQKGVS